MLFFDLRKQKKLADERNPMFEQNRAGKYLMYFMSLFWIGYLIFFGTLFAFALDDEGKEPYHMINAGLLFFSIIDFCLRIPFTKTPSQEIKPYLLLPIKRQRLIDFLLIRSGLEAFNIIWLFFFVPFGLFTVVRYYGFMALITYAIGIWLLTIINNYWYLLCRTLFDTNVCWVLLPLATYGGLLALALIPDNSPIYSLSTDLGELIIWENPLLAFVGIAAVIAILWMVNRTVISKVFYKETNHVADTKVKHVSNYRFLDRYGEVGEYMRLELKLLFRNKTCKVSTRSAFAVVLMFSILVCLDLYGQAGTNFLILYNYVLFGLTTLSGIMSYEGNYIDGLMTRKESIYTLLRSKYILYSLAECIPFLLMIPAACMGKVSILTSFSFAILMCGLVFFLLFQLAVYNKTTVSLMAKMTSRQNNNVGIQLLLTAGAFGLPLLIQFVCSSLFNDWVADLCMLLIGFAFIITSPRWLMNVYHRFMKRRYTNMENLRSTRQK